MALTIHVMDARGYRRSHELDDAAALLGRDDAFLWIDTDERTPALDAFLCEKLRLHPLVLEDIFADRPTPKVEDYGEYLYVVMHGVTHQATDSDALGTLELDLVIGSNWTFTHHGGRLQTVDDLADELPRNPRALARGAPFIAHALMDRLTDAYLPVVDRFDDEIDELEKRVVNDPDPSCMARLFALKRSIQKLRRVSVYQREVLQRLSRGEFERIPAAALPFYRDVYDHFVRISDLADSYRDLIGSALEMYMSVQANRTNEIMKVLAIISTVMLPLTFIAGVYGMNFEHMPELHWRYGYPMALGVMAVVAVVLIAWFRRRRWI